MWKTGIRAGVSRLDPPKEAEVGGGVCGSDKLRKSSAPSAGLSPAPSRFIHPFVTISGVLVLNVNKALPENPSF